MLSGLKRFISLLTLVVFLFPLVVEEVHTYEHRHDTHCTETGETHLHELEHHCKICDFVPLLSDKPVPHQFIGCAFNFIQPVIHFYQSTALEQHKFNYSLRGPPFVS